MKFNSIGNKICILFTLTVGLMSVGVGYGWFKLRSIHSEIESISNEALPLTSIVARITSSHLEQSIRYERAISYVLDKSERFESRMHKARAEFESYEVDIDVAFREAWGIFESHSFADDFERSKFDDIEQRLRRHKIEHDRFREQGREFFLISSTSTKEELALRIREIAASEYHLDSGLHSILDELDTITSEAIARTEKSESAAMTIMLTVTALSFALGGVLSYLLARRVSRSMRQATEIARAIADGDHITEFPELHDTETAELIAAMEQMHASIRWAESSLADAMAQAEAADNMKSRFLANMSHEIRTPISAIIGYADILGADSCSDADLCEGVRVIKRNGQHLLNLINDILDLSKLEAGQLELEQHEFQLVDLLEDMFSLFRARAEEKDLELTINVLTPCPSIIKSDENRIRQILINLVGNALKFTQRGAITIDICTLRESAGETLMQFSVTDTGIGISQDRIDKLFQPFVQADSSTARKYGGTGLGLAISQKFAAVMGGQIETKSEPGRGTTFHVILPCGNVSGSKPLEVGTLFPAAAGDVRTPSKKTDRTKEPSIEPAAPVACGRVLVAEDGKDNQRLIAHHLKRRGVDFEIVEDGQEALHAVDAAIAQSQPFTHLLLDIQMPIMDGYETAERLRDLPGKPVIIAVTAHAMQGDIDKCLAAGCDVYLPKPIDWPKLFEILNEPPAAKAKAA